MAHLLLQTTAEERDALQQVLQQQGITQEAPDEQENFAGGHLVEWLIPITTAVVAAIPGLLQTWRQKHKHITVKIDGIAYTGYSAEEIADMHAKLKALAEGDGTV